jgi:hypothetical protein
MNSYSMHAGANIAAAAAAAASAAAAAEELMEFSPVS